MRSSGPLTWASVNLPRRLATRLGRQRWLSTVAPVIVGSDRVASRLTRGRLMLPAIAGLPCLTLTVVGRRSGQPRSVPLLGMPWGDGWVVVGSNWGGDRTPDWVRNLRASPTAHVQVRGRHTAVVAREALGAERERLWAALLQVWPNYARYAERTDRHIPVLVLAPQPH